MIPHPEGRGFGCELLISEEFQRGIDNHYIALVGVEELGEGDITRYERSRKEGVEQSVSKIGEDRGGWWRGGGWGVHEDGPDGHAREE